MVEVDSPLDLNYSPISIPDDDHVVIQRLQSPRLQRYFGVEIECSSPYDSTRRDSIKHLQNNNERRSSLKPQSGSKRKVRSRSGSKKRRARAKKPKRTNSAGTKSSALRKDSDGKTSRLRSWLDRLQSDSSTLSELPSESPRVSIDSDESARSLPICFQQTRSPSPWRPSLPEICGDDQLLSALTAFMERIYCAENIRFLMAVQEFHRDIDRHIYPKEIDDISMGHGQNSSSSTSVHRRIGRDLDLQILSIFDEFIVPNAKHQLNVSSSTLLNALSQREQLGHFSNEQKRAIFYFCRTETEHLISSSVLGRFYGSNEFAAVTPPAPSRPAPDFKWRSSRIPDPITLHRQKTPIAQSVVSPAVSALAPRTMPGTQPLDTPPPAAFGRGYDDDDDEVLGVDSDLVLLPRFRRSSLPPLSLCSRHTVSAPIKCNMSRSKKAPPLAFDFRSQSVATEEEINFLTLRSTTNAVVGSFECTLDDDDLKSSARPRPVMEASHSLSKGKRSSSGKRSGSQKRSRSGKRANSMRSHRHRHRHSNRLSLRNSAVSYSSTKRRARTAAELGGDDDSITDDSYHDPLFLTR